MFEKSLSDMVKGIRAHKDEEGDFINKCLAEIKEELKNQDIALKAQAVQKLIYLHMLGYDISWASFHIVEVMSQPSFSHRRIAYLAASQSFGPKTDVILLTTHLFRKAFSQALSGSAAGGVAEGQMYDTGSAINCLANICTPDLANDLLSDLYGLMNSSKPYIRKKAVLVLLRIFHQWPKALRLSFDRLKAKLTDDDPTVVSAAVYVVCELARLNPKNYVALAPLFFKILTSSTNNWVLIKVVKLMGSLLPLEPRLAKKLAGPLCEIIETTAAKSLLYECVNTLLCGEVTSKNVLRTCVTKLRSFIEDTDQNLKYLGLLGLHRLMKQHPRAVAEHKDLILTCLTDDDVTIRMRALDLISGMVSKRNIKGIIKKLVEHLQTADGSYREHVLERVITICNQENYGFISDFEWYVATLVELTNVTGVSVSSAQHISQQLLDVTMRVEGVRPFAVAEMERLLLDSRLLTDRNEMSHVLFAAAWITGEYAEMVDDHLAVIRAMLSADVNTLPPDVQNVFLQAFYKVFAASLHQTFAVDGRSVIHVPQSLPMKQNLADDLGILGYTGDATPIKSAAERALSPASGRSPSPPSGGDGDDEISVSGTRDNTDDIDPDAPKEWTKYSYGGKRLKTLPEWQSHVQKIVDCITNQLPVFCLSNSVEVQERAVAYLHYVKWIAGQVLSPSTSVAEVANLISAFAGLFSEKLNPVNAKAQKKVALPTGLNLDKQINKVEDSDDEEEEDDGYSLDYRQPSFGESSSSLKLSSQEVAQRAADQRARDKARRANDPYYIKDTPTKDTHHASDDDEEEDKPKAAGAGAVEPSKDSKRKGHRARKSHAFSDDEEDEAVESRKSKYAVKTTVDMPAGASSDDDAKNSDEDDMLRGVDLTTPLGADEVMPRARTYAEVKEARDKQAAEDKKKKKKRETEEKDKKKKDKDKDKEKKHKKDKHKDKDSDDKDKEKSKKKDKKEDKSKEAAAPTVVADIFDPLAVSAAAKKPEKEEKEKSKKHHHKDDKEKEKKHKNKDKDKEKEKEKDSKDKKKSKSRDKEESSKDKDASASEKKSSKSAESAVPEEYADNAARERVLFSDGSVRVLYMVMTDSSSSRAATAHIKIHSAVNLDRVGVTISDSSFVRVRSKPIAAPNVAANKPVYLMGAIQLELAKLSGPQKLDAAITYNVDAKSKETKAKAELRVNCSDLLLPTRITIDDLRDLLARSGKSDEEKANSCGALASAQLPLSRHGVSDALKLIAKVLNVKLIEAVSFTATYYGRSIQGQHVAVLVKANKQDVQSERPVLSIDIKTSLQSFSDGLLQELRDLLV